jgi:hypothetical protein
MPILSFDLTNLYVEMSLQRDSLTRFLYPYFLFHWIDLKVEIGPDQVYFSFYDVFLFRFLKIMLRR